MALSSGVALAAQPLGDVFERWTPPAATKPDFEAVSATCAALDQAIAQADLEGAAQLLDFPVQLISDDAASAEVGLDRAHWIGLVQSAVDGVELRNLQLAARREVSFVSEALAVATVHHTASTAHSSKQWNSVYLLVRKGGAWKVKGLGGRGWGSLPSLRPPRVARATLSPAVELFNKRCATCHGKDGKGATVVGLELGIPDLTDPKLQARLSDEQVLSQILKGSFDAQTGAPRMTSYRDKYPEAELKDLVAVVRSLGRKATSRR